MPLAPSTRLGPYEIVAQIGAGGMGEVYRAADTNLKRQVAIKVLPEAVAQDVDRLARFQREAEVLATLNHPNIAAIYGLERTDGQTALVMELVEGPTLADRIEQGAIPLDEALPCAKQIADALGAAHGRGIIHRDLKPANIKLRSDGTVKVLDFGLAKATEPEVASSPGLSRSPTITTPAMTQLGLILGTAAYMSPEQARGKAIDKRADIWAFGCVLYEMLTGRRAFQGDDVTDVLVAVMSREPDWTALPAATPRAIRRLLRRTLERDVHRRLADIADARLELEDALTTSGDEIVSAPPPRLAWWRRLVLPAGTAVAAAAVAGFVGWMMKPDATSRPIARFAITLSADDEFSPAQATRNVIAVSPDSSRIAYMANGRLYLHTRDRLDSTVIAENGAMPFFSPDGQSVGFWYEGQLRRVSVNGGAAVPISTAPYIWGATWELDDTILYGLGPDGIWRVPASGGKPEQVIKVDAGQRAHGPQFLPGRRAVLFTLGQAEQSWDDAQIVVQSLDGGSRHVVIQGGTDARYLPTGHLVYARGGSLLAQPFDLQELKTSAGPVSVVDGVAQAIGGATGAAHFSVSADATLVYVPSSSLDFTEISYVWVDRTGRETPVSAPVGIYLAPTLSPDGGRVAFIRMRGGNPDVWTYEFRRGILQPLTIEPGRDSDPIWSPDGKRIAYLSSSHKGGPGIFVRAADGTGDVERLTTGTHIPNSWSSDETRLVYTDFGTAPIAATSPTDLGVVVLTGDRHVEKLVVTPAREGNGVISPDQRWLAYESSETGEKAIVVQPFPDVSKGRVQISNAGVSPVWAKDGRTLFYRSGRTIMAVAVPGATTADWGTPAKLFEGSFFFVEGPTMFDVAPDGRFLMPKVGSGSAGAQAAKRLIVVQNWFDELRRLVPTRSKGKRERLPARSPIE